MCYSQVPNIFLLFLGIKRLQGHYSQVSQGPNRLAFEPVADNPLQFAALGLRAAALAGMMYAAGGDDIVYDILRKTFYLK